MEVRVRLTSAGAMVACFLVCLSPLAFSVGFFGNELSQREEQVLSKSLGDMEKATDGIDTLLLMMQFESFSKGECGAYFEVEEAAKKGDAQKQYLLGNLYRNGYCVPQDDTRALHWVRSAAEAGNKDAFFDFGLYLLNGIGGAENPKAAFIWLDKAKTQRPDAYAILAGMFLDGKGVPKNYSKALDYALVGAEYGDARAQFFASALLAESSLPFADPRSAYRWALIAQSSGHEKIVSAVRDLVMKLESELTPQQITQAQSMAAGWEPRSSKEQAIDPNEYKLPILRSQTSKDLSPKQARERLAELGLDIDRFLYFKAIGEDNLEVTRLYVNAGASIEEVSPLNFYTPLQFAAFKGSMKVVRYLVSAGADINLATNDGGDTPVLYALSEGHKAVAEYLIEQGAKLDHPGLMYNAVEFNDPGLLEKLREKGVPIDTDYVGTPLANAVASTARDLSEKRCLSKSAAWLIDQGADTNFRSKETGRSPLENALTAVDSVLCVELLLRNGANLASASDSDPLLVAIMSGNAELTQILLDHGADPNQAFKRNKNEVPMSLSGLSKDLMLNGGTLLHIAVAEQQASVVRILVRSGADPYAVDAKKRTPLSIAEAAKNKLMIAVLKGEI